MPTSAAAWHLERGRRDREAQARVRDGHADDAAEPGKKGALGEDVPYQVPGAAPEGAPDRKLVPPAQPACRQQARHIDARHQQHRPDRGQQPSQRGAHVAGDLQVEGRDDGRDGERGLAEGVAGQRGQLRARLLGRDPRSKTHNRRVVELAEPARLLRRVAERLEDLRRTAAAGRQRREPIQVGKPERLGEHADHLDPFVVQREHPPDNARVAAERPLPTSWVRTATPGSPTAVSAARNPRPRAGATPSRSTLHGELLPGDADVDRLFGPVGAVRLAAGCLLRPQRAVSARRLWWAGTRR